MNVQNKKVLVCGIARSGIAAAVLLVNNGAVVTLQDKKELSQLGDLSELQKKGIQIYAGKNPDEIIGQQDLVVVSPGIPTELQFFSIAKELGIPVWGEVELAYHFSPCPMAAITGTNGKTTTTALVGEMLKEKYPQSAVVGNIGIPFCSIVEDLTAQDYIVAEISSFQLETIDAFQPKISAVLNISPDHLNRHKTMERYIAAKERIFENQNQEDFCVLNYDDSVCREMAEKCKGKKVYFSSRETLSQGIYLDKDRIILAWEKEKWDIASVNELIILGKHNWENAMAAIAISFCAGVPMEGIKKALLAFQGVAHRIEYVDTVDGVAFYNDSKATNPDAAIRGVEAMTKPIVLLAGGYNKDADFSSWVATFPGRVKELILLGETASQIEEAAQKIGFHEITHVSSLEEGVITAKRKAVAGDCVLLSPACASWDMFQDFEQRGDAFKQFVRDNAAAQK